MQDAYNGEVKNIVAYSRLMNFYISHIPSEESTRLLVAFAKALISEDLGLEGMWWYRIIIYFNNSWRLQAA